MAIKGTSTDYSNRKIDLHIFQGVKAPGSSLINPSFGKISNFCTGVQKLVQRYTICLLTEIGSQENYPDFGSSLLPTLTSSGNLYNRADLYPIFNDANAKILKEFAAYEQTTTLPSDERLANARLVQILSTTDGVAIEVQLITFSNEELEFIIPLPV